MTNDLENSRIKLETFKLPDVGEGLTEAEIIRWMVKVGDEVSVNQVIVEIETAKAAVELPSPFAGQVRELLVKSGEVIAVGTPIISIATTREKNSVLVGYGAIESSTKRRRRLQNPLRNNASETKINAVNDAATLTGGVATVQRGVVRAKPLVRKLAKDLGINLERVSPTGADGDITRDDVLALAQQDRHPTRSGEADEIIPVRGVQKAMADSMVESFYSAPHVTIWTDVDMSRTLDIVQKLRAHKSYVNTKATPLLLSAAAIAAVAREYPRINATWVQGKDGADVHLHKDVHLGIAADTPRGLLVPVLKNCGQMTLPQLAEGITGLIENARLGKSSPSDLAGGTITLTNVGVFGIDGGTPILNPGQTAIFAMGQIKAKPWIVDNEIAIRPVMQISMSFDHRVIDGAIGSRALKAIADYLADPALGIVLND